MRGLIYVATIVLTLTSTKAFAQSDPSPVNPAFVVDRLVHTLTGLPATKQQIEDYISGQRSLVEIANSLRMSPRTEARLAHFWLEKAGLNNPVLVKEDVAAPIGSELFGEVVESRPINIERFLGRFGDAPSWNRNITQRNVASANREYCMNRYGTDQRWYFKVHESNPDSEALVNCACEQDAVNPVVGLRPWWDRSTSIVVCAKALDPKYCGDDLQNCWPDDEGNDIYAKMQYGFTYEPGMIAAKNIVYGEPWTEVLTTTKGYANGHMLAFIGRPNNSLILHQNAPPGSFPNIEANQNVIRAKLDPFDPAIKDSNGSRFVEYERGPNHSGILTTVSFQLANNGWRAAFSTSRSAFLCKDFVPPKNISNQPVPGDDLAENPYCLFCHSTIEPARKFFQKWPDVGDLNYLYGTTDPARDQTASYIGQNGKDVDDLARIYTNSNDFKQCASKRAFEFLMGRPMKREEENSVLPILVDVYENNSEQVWPVMLTIINSPIFAGGQ